MLTAAHCTEGGQVIKIITIIIKIIFISVFIMVIVIQGEVFPRVDTLCSQQLFDQANYVVVGEHDIQAQDGERRVRFHITTLELI